MPRVQRSAPKPSQPQTAVVAANGRLSAKDRREQLIEVAVDLFSRKGFKGTTTREIAAAAGVTEAIIFRHFATKEQLYTAIIDQKVTSAYASAWIAELRLAMDRNDDEAVVRELIRAIIYTHRTDPKFERLMMYAALEGNEVALLHMRHMTTPIVEAYRSYLSRRQKQKVLRSIGAEAALAAIAGMAQSFALRKYVHAFKEACLSDDQAIEAFTRIALEGLSVGRNVRSSVKNGSVQAKKS